MVKTEPVVSKELIDWLESLYPDQHPGKADQREADRAFGRIEVVRKLRATHDRQATAARVF